MNLNKIIVVMLMLFMMLSNALPAGAVRGKKRSVAQRRSESDSYSMDSSDDSDDGDGVDSETGDECVDMDVFDSEEDASNLGDTPAKKRRLSNTGFAESKILVMKLGPSEVKTFNSFLEASSWLQDHGWPPTSGNINQAVQKLCLSCGWGWEVRDKSEELINLLKAEPSPGQIDEAKSRTRKRRRIFVGSDELLVMSLEKDPVKTFNSFLEARSWLQDHGWPHIKCGNIKQAVQGLHLSCGWGWEVRDKSEELIKLLDAKLSPEQIKEAKSLTKERRLVFNSSDELLVMSLGKNPVKTFNSFLEARRWLRDHGWPSANCCHIKKAIQEFWLSYGWGWEVRNKSEELINLLEAEPSPEQIKEVKSRTKVGRLVLNSSDELLVMSLGENPVKTFNSFLEAERWLRDHGWSIADYNIKRAIQKLGLSCGWGWEVQDKSEELINLLKAEPSPEQIDGAKNLTKNQRIIGSDELIVMSLEENPVKTFNSFLEASKWLQDHGWPHIKCGNIKQAVQGLHLSCGWGWEVRDKSEELIDLLKVELSPEQIDKAKSLTKERKLVLDSSDVLLVMSLGKNPVKTFTSSLEAERWLQDHGWKNASNSNINRSMRLRHLAYGWKWEVLHRTKSLNDLLYVEPTSEQIDEAKRLIKVGRLVFDSSDELLVMSLGKNPVKTFTSSLEAERWLQDHGWKNASNSNINRSMRLRHLAYGWKWEVLHRTKSLNDLLYVEPTPEQIDEAKNLTRGYKKKQGAESVEFSTKPIVEETQKNVEEDQSGCPNIDQAVQSSISSCELGQENQGEMERSEAETSAKEDETKKEIGISSLFVGSDELLEDESVEFSTKPIVEKTQKTVEEDQSSCPNIDQAVQSSILSCELVQENQGEMGRSETETSAKGDKTKKMSISFLINSTEPVEREIRDSGVEKPMSSRNLEHFDEFNVCKPSGLLNTNNQCFLNAIMQQLYRVKKFRNYILETEMLERENLIQYCLKEIFTKMRYGCTDITDISNKLRMAIFNSNSTQEDVSDLFYKVCDAIQENISELGIGVKFRIRGLSESVAPIWIIANDELSRLQDYLDRGYVNQMFQIAELSEDVMLRVSHCPDAEKIAVPQELAFKADNYELSGGITYIGDFLYGLRGHYISYVKEGDMWFEINDSAINIVIAEEVGENLSQNGCLLRYTKIKR